MDEEGGEKGLDDRREKAKHYNLSQQNSERREGCCMSLTLEQVGGLVCIQHIVLSLSLSLFSHFPHPIRSSGAICHSLFGRARQLHQRRGGSRGTKSSNQSTRYSCWRGGYVGWLRGYE
jgi:hypothetical protein